MASLAKHHWAYNLMEAAGLCCEEDPDPSGTVEKDIVSSNVLLKSHSIM